MKSDTNNQEIPGDREYKDILYEELDNPFQAEEIKNEIKRLKKEKATGLDGIMNEVYISCESLLVPVLVKIFNKILNSGKYPSSWSKGIVVPIHKKGSITDVNNYRPITLLNHSAKLFSAVINTRLMKLCEDNNILTDAQFGFRPNLGTVDAVSLLHAIVSRYINTNKRLYCCFVDYTKAFDSIIYGDDSLK